MAEKDNQLYDIVSKHIQKLYNQEQQKADMDSYYEAFGIPEEDRAKFVFEEIGNTPYDYEHWNRPRTFVTVAPWREDMVSNFGNGVSSTSQEKKSRKLALQRSENAAKKLDAGDEDVNPKQTVLSDNANYSWNRFNLLKRYVETKYPGLVVSFNSGLRLGQGQKEHGSGQAFDAQIANYAGNKHSHTLNTGVLYDAMHEVFGDTVNQYIDETLGNGYWSHISNVQPMQDPTYKIDEENKEMFEFNPNIKNKAGRIARKIRSTFSLPSDDIVNAAIQLAIKRGQKK